MRDYIRAGISPVKKMALGQIKKEIEHAKIYYKTNLSVCWPDPGLHSVLGSLFTEIL